MYYFYFNFPNYKSKSIIIHDGNCGDCNSSQGKLGSLSNSNGFWAGPFKTVIEVELALNKLLKLVEHKFNYEKCSRCLTD